MLKGEGKVKILGALREAEYILDVGSGTSFTYHKFLEGENIIHVDINKNAFHTEVVCDAHQLPFRENAFITVYAAHIIEHLTNPIKAIMEFKRVSKNRVIIKVPNASYYKARPSGKNEHIFSWNEWTLETLLRRFFPVVRIKKTQRTLFHKVKPSKAWKFYLLLERFLFGCNELTAICQKWINMSI